ncbi:hypothetical protein QWI17_00955 [Gilvimarinus sp. SDUM040013]|uniref:Uncharacterized protein n=1 Tax=Gilvimarinus gilvus TaxID=3058038 RepID=A0ABU4S539_9GAMM|nr:hypothetical protein [Gilvimarinus sp. SDUM040013]MDO3384398.1 hypothetical protein [Gilvimarinus sp. SDUM040013]MDX6851003.1 hypothetical protein [Gilvimarinus sp. SDUM040013]
MWDFNLGEAIGLMRKTVPFLLMRLVVYVGITLAYILITGVGAGIGYGVTSFGDGQGGGAFIGGAIGFGLVSAVLYFAREYLLYLIKAGHIAVLVELIQDKELPEGRSQIEHGQAVVKERFKESSILFGLDQLIKGILRALNRMTMMISNFIPIPGLSGLVGFVNKIINVSLTYVDEVILAYNIKIGSDNPWQSSKDALILYAQNYKTMLKNAVFLMLFMYVTAFLIFLVVVAPVAGLVALFPGSPGAMLSVIFAVILAWSIKAAVLEPLAVAAMMQVYFKTIEGQTPNPEWDQKLSGASDKFREMGEKAASYVGGSKAETESQSA